MQWQLHQTMKELEEKPSSISKFKPLTNKYNWEERNFFSNVINLKRFETTKRKVAFNVLILQNNREKIQQVFISKRN